MIEADLDDADRRILGVLQTAGRIPNAELAERAGLSASASHRRMRRLEASGVIAGYAVDAPLLTLESDEQSPLQPAFDCAFELQNGALLPSIGGRDVCDGRVRDAADLIDFLAPVVL